MASKSPASSDSATRPGLGNFRGLIAILIGITLGALLGVLYGKAMWMAADGPDALLVELNEIKQQKSPAAKSEQQAREAEAQAKSLAAQADEIDQAANNAADEASKTAFSSHAERLRAEATRLRSEANYLNALANQQLAKLNDAERTKLTKQLNTIDERIQRVAQDAAQAKANHAAHRDWLPRLAWDLCKFLGDLFLQVLKLLVIPLVVTSMICGITSLGDIRKVGRMGRRTILYYLTTSGLAVCLGIILVLVIQPGVATDDTFAYEAKEVATKKDTSALDTLLNVVRGQPEDKSTGMFPENIFKAAAEFNVLALIVFALVFGAALTTLGQKGQGIIDFFNGANEAVMKMVHFVMLCAPVGIFGLVAANIAKNGGGAEFGQQLARLAWYVGTVLLGLVIHTVLLSALLALIARRNPVTYAYGLLRALLTAVSTASSSATLPVTMECCEENNGVSNRSASFVLPLGATVNMDGTALYEAVAVIFIAQSSGIPLSFGALVVIFITATLAAIGAAGIPEAGLVTMVIVLTAVGLPTAGIGTILAIDWFLDRLRTTVNVYGDAIGAGIIDSLAEPSPG